MATTLVSGRVEAVEVTSEAPNSVDASDATADHDHDEALRRASQILIAITDGTPSREERIERLTEVNQILRGELRRLRDEAEDTAA